MLFSKILNITLIINIEFLIQRRVVFTILRQYITLRKVIKVKESVQVTSKIGKYKTAKNTLFRNKMSMPDEMLQNHFPLFKYSQKMKRFYVIKTKYIPYLFFSAMNFLNKSFLEKLSPQSFTITITNCQNVKEVDNLQLGEKNSQYLDADSKVKIQNFVPIFRQCRQLFFPWFILLQGQKKEKSKSAKFTILGPNSLALNGWTRWTKFH